MPEYALRISIVLAFLGGASGCVSWELPDLDGDGAGVGTDCNVLDPNIGPSQEEIWYDGIDQNCDGNDDDQDGDGFASVDSPTGEGVDCWDDPNTTPEAFTAVDGYEQLEAALVFPGSGDTWYDGLDSDCAGNSDFDQDSDGYDSATHPRQDGTFGVDCVDGSENNHYLEEFPDEWSAWTDLGFDEGDIHPEVADDVCYDGINADCDETVANGSNLEPDSYRNDFDCDKDGFDIAQECDDENAAILPNDEPDTWYDCVDSDCDGNDGDQDGDGYTPDFVLDTSGAELINYADSTSSAYCDLNQFSQHLGAGDCVDDPTDVPPTLPGFTELGADDIHSLITDVFYDGVDADCGGESDFDQDGDGYDSSEHARDAAGTDFGQDCNDTDPNINPSRFEICESGTQVDQNCNGDANDQGAFGCTNYYTDLDADGHGVGSSTCRCEAYQVFTSLLADDCDDADATVSPSDSEVCDGQDNDCTRTSNTDGIPLDEVDNDGDATVECALDSGGWDGTSAVTAWEDCDDGDGTIHPAAPEICDGQDNDCTRTSSVDGIPLNEVDNDSDGYVECLIDLSGGWDGAITTPFSQMLGEDCNDADNLTRKDIAVHESNASDCMTDSDQDGYGDVFASGGGVAGTDCVDSDATVHPTAAELCDGLDNDCTRTGSTDGIPLNEVDNDSDSYVECTIDSGGWDTSPTKQGDDCDDADATENPGASEICDGQANNCDGSIPLDEVDNDGDGYVECTLNGGWDGSGTKLGDDCLDTDATVNPGASEICDGQANNCDGSIPSNEVDDDSDGYVECTLNGGWDGTGTKLGDDCNDVAANNGATVNPGAAELCDGLDNDCTRTGSTDGIPLNEVDNDNDGYVECTLNGGWDGAGNKLGDDCDDTDDTVSPGDTEICDGQDNDCSLGSGAIPADEVDNDSDGYVECTLNGTWDGTGNKQGGDCDDTDATVSPGDTEICDGQDNDCSGGSGAIPADEVDDDSDGYVECTLNGAWDGTGNKQGGDCDDTDNTVRPGATEICDGQDNTCNGSQLASEADDDNDGYVECTLNGGWDGPGSKLGDDCDDTDATVSPGDSEICDGQDNDCTRNNSTDGIPTNEVDDDNDGYVECTISGGWDGTGSKQGGDCDDTHNLTFPGVASLDSSSLCMRDADNDNRGSTTAPTGGSAGTDCDDTDATVKPGATELCDGQVNACNTSLGSEEIDNDSDGFVECTIDSGGWDGSGTMLGDDCNDVLANNGATINPGATELCDGLDNDCSASGASDGIPGNEVDNDSDGYVECSIDSNGWDTSPLKQGDDCNDVLANNGANVNPGETEICDASNTDEDCNGVADDNDSGVTGTTAWYTDADSDGYGNENAMATQACEDTNTTSATNDDCDDTDSNTFPGAASEDSPTACMTDADGDDFGSDSVSGTVQAGSDCDDTSSSINTDATEVCDTSGVVDEDCNGFIDDADSGVTGTTTWYDDGDGDGEGDVDDSGVDLCAQPSNTATVATDCDDSNSAINAAATETSNEEDDDCNDLVDEGFRLAGALIFTEVEGDPLGFSSDISEGQWFEVYNPSATTDLHMGGVEFFTNCDGSGANGANDSFFIPVNGLTIGAEEYAVFCKSSNAAGGNCDYIYGSDAGQGTTTLGDAFNADIDILTGVCRLQLFLNSVLLDTIKPRDALASSGATSPWLDKEEGVAFSLDPSLLDDTLNDDGANWCYPADTEIYDSPSGTEDNYGTPGTAASGCETTAP